MNETRENRGVLVGFAAAAAVLEAGDADDEGTRGGKLGAGAVSTAGAAGAGLPPPNAAFNRVCK